MNNNEPEIKAETTVSQEKTESNGVQQPIDTPSNSEVQKPNTPETIEDPNWKAFREARKKDRAEREAAERKAMEKEAEVAALKAAMEAAFNKSTPIQPVNQYSHDYPQEESEDDRIEKKVQAAIAQREQEYERQRAIREQQEYPQRLVQTYSDFNETISPENLDYLDYHFPEVSRPLKRLNDDFDKWADIYKAIKKFVPNHANSRKDAARADANFNKPKSISSPSITQTGEPLGNARLTAEKRAENWERMQKTLRSVG